MNHTVNNKLIEDFITDHLYTEKIDTSAVSPVVDSSSKDLADSLISNPEFLITENTSHQKITDYINTLLPPKQQVYNHHLSLLLKDLFLAQQHEEIHTTYTLAEKIFVDYADKLSFDNAIKILLIFVENDLFNHLYDQSLVVLRGLHEFYPLLKIEEKKSFDFFIAQCLFHFGLQNNNRDHLYQAIIHSRHMLRYPNIEKDQLNIALFVIIKSFEALGVYDESLLAIEEYFRIFPVNKNNPISVQILFLQGINYEALGESHLALASFRTYLTINPNDQEAKKIIRLLAEKEGE